MILLTIIQLISYKSMYRPDDIDIGFTVLRVSATVRDKFSRCVMCDHIMSTTRSQICQPTVVRVG